MGTRIRTFTVEGHVLELFVSDCANCGIVFGIPKDLERRRREDKGSFFCPNGHSLVFSGKTEEEKLREQLAAARSLAERESVRRRQAEGQRAAARGEVTLIRKRVGNGICPCCNRTFKDLAQHMAGQHPEFRLDVEESNPGITTADLSANQVWTLQAIAAHLDQDEEGMPEEYVHAHTMRALERRGVVDLVEGVVVPTATGLRLIAALGSAR